MQTLRRQRRRIALRYLDQLQEEFQELIEISRLLAVMSPELIGMEEMERWKLSLGFCRELRVPQMETPPRPSTLLGVYSALGTWRSPLRGNWTWASTRIAEAAVRSANPSASGDENIGGF